MPKSKLENKRESREHFENETANRIDQIINVTENHTRTERHLEQDFPFTSPKAKAHEEKIQKEREEEVAHLKNIIAYGKHEDH